MLSHELADSMQTRAMRKLWLSVSIEDSQHMIDMLDVNHDNRVSMDEFRRFVYLLPESLVSHPAHLLHERVSGTNNNKSPF